MDHKLTPKRELPRRTAGLTAWQIWVLILVAVVGISSLAWAAQFLLRAGSPQTVLAGTAPLSDPNQPDPAAASFPAESALAFPTPPAACAARSSSMRLASSAQVIDNRTLEVIVDGETLRVGLAGIALPEDGPLSSQIIVAASDFTAYPPLLLVLDSAEHDSGGRLLHYVFSGDRFLNLDLVRLGLAQADINAPDRACLALFQQAEQQARAERIGIWQPAAVPTATFMPFVTLDPSRQAPCDCASRPLCSDFDTRVDAQACYNACNDYNSRLDWDRDGRACEGLP